VPPAASPCRRPAPPTCSPAPPLWPASTPSTSSSERSPPGSARRRAFGRPARREGAEAFVDAAAGAALGALAVALDLPHPVVEEDPLDAEERHEHRRQPGRRRLAAGDLDHPLFEYGEAEASKDGADRLETLEDPPELLGRIGEVDD